MLCAPVIIPTLNRKEHLQRCITSLQNNTLAPHTELIIGVDYPPTDKYVKGYQEVCEYLQKGIKGFKHVEVIYHQQNLGPYENYRFLKRYVMEKCDRYIFTEDDNEMSPNFLDYINRGLKQFEENRNILAICANGVEGEKESINENIVKTHNFSAHGYGTWGDREDMLSCQITREYIGNVSRNIKKIWKLYKYDPSLIFACQSVLFRKEKLYQVLDGSVPIIDMTIKIYAVTEDKYVICPCLKKARNWGWDGSGVNCVKTEEQVAVIDDRESFIYQYDEPIRECKNDSTSSFEVKLRICVAVVKMFIARLLKE